MSRWPRLIAATLTLSLCSPSRADDTHYQDFLVGGRSIGLGGAFTSLGDDPASVYFNPAGLGDARGSNLQVSTSLYGFERGSIGGNLTLPVPGVEQRNIEFTDLVIIPASAGYIQSFGPLDAERHPYQAYGLSVLVPSYRSFKVNAGDSSATGENSYQRRVTDRELWSGAGYGRRISTALRLGVSAYYILRSVVDTEDVSVRERLADGSDKFQTVTNDIAFTNGSAVLIAGARYQASEALSLGIALQSPSVQLHSNASLRFSRAAADPSIAVGGEPTATFDALSPNTAASETRYAPSLRAGASLSRKYKYTFSADVSYHAPVRYTLIAVDDAYKARLPFTPEIDRRGVLNVNLGAEYLVIREVSIAGGVFTDFSSAPAIDPAPLADQPPRVNLLGFSAALGYFGTHTLSRVGMVYSFGTGYDVIPERGDINRVLGVDQAFQRIAYSQSFFYIFVSSTFRY